MARSYWGRAGGYTRSEPPRVVVHGFASLEAVGGFGLPVDLDETY